MQFKAKITGHKVYTPSSDSPSVLSITVETPFTYDSLDEFDRLYDKDIRVEMKIWREPRSRSSNNYFYVLVGKLADALRVSKPYIHNLMLRKYGQLERIDGKPVWVILPETDEISTKVDEDETLHVRPTDDVREGNDGKMYRTYLLLKGSHALNSQEMSILIDGIVAECKEQGIETLPPEEIEHMKKCWGVEI